MTADEQARFNRAQWRFLLCSIAAYALVGMALFMLAWNAAPDGYSRRSAR